MVPMTTVESFNSTLKSFLQELVDIFPDEPGIDAIALFLGTFDMFIAGNPRAAMDAFLEKASPYADCISQKDPSMFDTLELPGGISLKGMWAHASDQTKEATFQYLQMLFLLATTAAAVPQDMLNSIETLASNYASKIQSGEMDITSLATMLMSGGGLEGLEGLGDLQKKLPRQ